MALRGDDETLPWQGDPPPVVKKTKTKARRLRLAEAQLAANRTALAAQMGVGELTLDPNDPKANARLMLGDDQTLRRYRETWWRWIRNCYRAYGEEVIAATASTFLENAQRMIKVDDGAGNMIDKPAPFKPKKKDVMEVVSALNAITQLADDLEAPAWIDPEPTERPPADEMLACGNGLLHVPTGAFMPPTTAFFNLAASTVRYDPDAPEPTQWLAFLKQLLPKDQAAIDLLQEWFGYCLLPDTSQHKMLLMIGPRRSGKSTIARILTGLLGSTSVTSPTMASLADRFGLEPLLTKPLAIVGDAKIGRRTDTSAIAENLLRIVGEDPVDVERKHRSALTAIRLKTRFMILANDLPSLNDNSSALAGRYLVLQLTESFYGKEDPGLTGKLLTELPGILNWSITGYRRLQERGKFVQPKSGLEDIETIEMLGSPVKSFMADCCKRGPKLEVSVDELWSAYSVWAKEQNVQHAGTKLWFGRNLRSAAPGVRLKKARTGETRTRVYVGIALSSF